MSNCGCTNRDRYFNGNSMEEMEGNDLWIAGSHEKLSASSGKSPRHPKKSHKTHYASLNSDEATTTDQTPVGKPKFDVKRSIDVSSPIASDAASSSRGSPSNRRSRRAYSAPVHDSSSASSSRSSSYSSSSSIRTHKSFNNNTNTGRRQSTTHGNVGSSQTLILPIKARNLGRTNSSPTGTSNPNLTANLNNTLNAGNITPSSSSVSAAGAMTQSFGLSLFGGASWVLSKERMKKVLSNASMMRFENIIGKKSAQDLFVTNSSSRCMTMEIVTRDGLIIPITKNLRSPSSQNLDIDIILNQNPGCTAILMLWSAKTAASSTFLSVNTRCQGAIPLDIIVGVGVKSGSKIQFTCVSPETSVVSTIMNSSKSISNSAFDGPSITLTFPSHLFHTDGNSRIGGVGRNRQATTPLIKDIQFESVHLAEAARQGLSGLVRELSDS